MIIYTFINSSMQNSNDEIYIDLSYFKARMTFLFFFFLPTQTIVLNLGNSNINTLSKVEKSLFKNIFHIHKMRKCMTILGCSWNPPHSCQRASAVREATVVMPIQPHALPDQPSWRRHSSSWVYWVLWDNSNKVKCKLDFFLKCWQSVKYHIVAYC